jgi:hypothetical protein
MAPVANRLKMLSFRLYFADWNGFSFFEFEQTAQRDGTFALIINQVRVFLE